jgi:hypothetical protein
VSAIDPFDVLVAMAPPASARAPLAPGADARYDAMFRRAAAAATPARRPRRWRRRIVVGGLVIGIVGGSSVAAAVLLHDDRPANPTRVACVASADPEASGVALPVPDGASLIEACAPLWSDGTFGTGGPPPLVACVTADDATAVVVPGADPSACAAAGFAPASDLDAALTRQVAIINARVVAPLGGAACFDEARAAALIDGVLADPELAGWRRGDDAPLTSQGPCAAVAIDARLKTVSMLPRPLPPNGSRPTDPSSGR